MNVLEINKLKKVYGNNLIVLNDFSLKVKKGIIFGLVGPNGAGKSTLINILSGLVKKDDGDVLIFGKKVNKKGYEHKKRMGFVLDQPIYLEKLTGEEYLDFSAVLHQLDKNVRSERVRELLDFFDLNDKKNNFIETYSKGMKKKIALAAAFIHQPDLLILDEPFEGIDLASVKNIKENLSYMTKKGITILLASHQFEIIEQISDEIGIINEGKLINHLKNDRLLKGSNRNLSLEEVFNDSISGVKLQTKNLSWLKE